MAFRFESGDVVVSGKNADAMAGLAFIGMAAVGVVSFKIGERIGDYLGTLVYGAYLKRKEKLNN